MPDRACGIVRAIGHRSGRSQSGETFGYMIKIDWRPPKKKSERGVKLKRVKGGGEGGEGYIFDGPLNPRDNVAHGSTRFQAGPVFSQRRFTRNHTKNSYAIPNK